MRSVVPQDSRTQIQSASDSAQVLGFSYINADTVPTGHFHRATPAIPPSAVRGWGPLAALLFDTTRLRPLAPTGDDNVARPVDLVDDSDPGQHTVLVAPVRSDLIALDLDGCASEVLPAIIDAADDAAASIAYTAESGSPDSMHVILACPTSHSRAFFLDALASIRAHFDLSPSQLDHRSGAGGALRLPGSPSLKRGRGFVQPVNDSGAPLDPATALHRARTALAAAKLPTTATRSSRVAAAPAPTTVSTDGLPERAWRYRYAFTPAELRLLRSHPRKGRRSDQATRGALVLIRHGIRSWVEAAKHYRAWPVFAKFSRRADRGRAHWDRVALQALAHRPALTAETRRRCHGWLRHGATWTDHDVATALVAVLHHRFSDGRGHTTRPIAVRDVALWCAVSVGTAHRLLAELVQRGALSRERHWCDGPANEASLYTLAKPPRENFEHDITPLDPEVCLADVWHTLGAPARALWSLLGSTGAPAASLAAPAGLPTGRRGRSGALLLLHRLAQAGLAEQTNGLWRLGTSSLSRAATALGASAARHNLHRLITAERTLWHASDVAERRTAVHYLHRYRFAHAPAPTPRSSPNWMDDHAPAPTPQNALPKQ